MSSEQAIREGKNEDCLFRARKTMDSSSGQVYKRFRRADNVAIDLVQ